MTKEEVYWSEVQARREYIEKWERFRQRNEELVVELARVSAEASDAREEVRRLRTAIETHRDQTGHNLCWLNDVKLWEVLGDGVSAYPHVSIPSEEEFFLGCRAYYASRFK